MAGAGGVGDGRWEVVEWACNDLRMENVPGTYTTWFMCEEQMSVKYMFHANLIGYRRIPVTFGGGGRFFRVLEKC